MTALSRPSLIARTVTVLALAGIVVAVILLVQGGGKTYTVHMQLDNAYGLRAGSQVRLGGVPVGSVKTMTIGAHDVVKADLDLDPAKVRVGRGFSADIAAANLLGEKFVALHPGDQAAPLPSGSALPQAKVTVPTDLDQILNVLDADTRTRLSILINETGVAVAGRRSDVSAVLRQLPLSAEAATNLLTQLVQDNHTLQHLVASGGQFISRLNTQKADLRNVINAASGAATTGALVHDQLQQTLAGAPGALRTLQGFLGDLQSTTIPLGPAARAITASAKPLSNLLAQVPPFQRAAIPTLNKAVSVAPLLSRLGDKATPDVRRAVPTIDSLTNLSGILSVLSPWLPGSVNDLLGAMFGWTSGIQYRDGLGHVFHANVNISPSLVVNLANLGANLPALAADKKSTSLSTQLQSAAGGSAVKPPARSASGGGTSGGGTSGGGGSGGQQQSGNSAGSGQSGGGAAAAAPALGPSTLSNLLSYLLGK